MASVWKHPKSRFWTACFTDRDGRRLKRSTKATTRKEALRFAYQFEEAARHQRTAQQVRKVIQDLHGTITGESLARVSLRECVARWLVEKEHSTSVSTIGFYRNATGALLSFLGPKADGDIMDVTRADLIAYRNHRGRQLAASTVNLHIKAFRMLFRAAKRDSLITENPCEFVDAVKGRASAKRRAFTVEELKSVLAVAQGEWRSMILCGVYTGQRLSDLANLRWSDIDLNLGEIKLATVKTGRRLIIPMANPLREHLQTMAAAGLPSAPVHPEAHAVVQSQQGRTGTLSNRFVELLAKAGLRKKSSHRKDNTKNGRGGARETLELSFHCLRHTAVTLLKEAGVPAAVVMEMIGHDSAAISQHYTHVGRDAMEQAAQSLPDIR